MKRLSFAVLLISFLVTAAAAEIGRYTIFSGAIGGGWGSKKTAILLDTETGETWRYADEKWQPIPIIGPEKTLSQAIEEFLANGETEEEVLLEQGKKAKIEKSVNLDSPEKTPKASVNKKAVSYAKKKIPPKTSAVKKSKVTASSKVKEPANEPPEWL